MLYEAITGNIYAITPAQNQFKNAAKLTPYSGNISVRYMNNNGPNDEPKPNKKRNIRKIIKPFPISVSEKLIVINMVNN